jgi:hypothetical protein
LKYAIVKSSTNKLYYPFAEHRRFKFWAYDLQRRHRCMNQFNIYINKLPEDANITVKEVKELLKHGNGSNY